MGKCYQCDGYMEWSGTCPDCKRNDDLTTEQRNIAFDVAEAEERAKERLQNDAHIKEVLRKLLDLALESLEDADLAEKKVRVIMQSAIFADNESDFFPEIQANIFLADCYYTLRLGANPSIEQVSKLSVTARNFLIKWADSHRNAMYASQAREVYTNFRLEKEEQERKDAEERTKQQSIWEKENAKREAESKKNRLAAEARENAKNRTQTFAVIIAASFCSLFFIGGFWVGGLLKLNLWISESNYTAIVTFVVLFLISSYITFVSAKDYIFDILRKNYPSDVLRLWLLGSGIILLFIGTCLLWKETTGLVRVVFIALTVGLPMIPFVRGVLGSFAFGIVGGLLSLPVSYIAGGVISFAYSFIFAPTTQMPSSQSPVPAREVPPKRSGSENRLEVNTTEVLGFEQALQLADAGEARAQAIVSIYYGVGYKAKKDATKAADYAKRSAKQRNPLGIYRVAAMMENGDGFEKDVPQAKKLKELAFEGLNSMSGDPYALTALGIMLFRGEGGLNQNREQAVVLYRKAADLGYAPAQYNYSAALALGQGVPKNEQESLKWWRRAYEQNYPPAMDGPVGQASSNVKPTENASSAHSLPPKPKSNQKLPQGIPVSGRPGFVASPYAPGAGFIDARGMPPGSIATCPFTKEPFIIPAR